MSCHSLSLPVVLPACRYDQVVMAQQAAVCAVLGVMVGGGVSAVAWLAGEPSLAGLALPRAAAVVAYQLYEFFRRYLFAHGRPAAGLWVDLLRFGLQLLAILALPYAWPGATAEAGIWIAMAACAVEIGRAHV